MQQYRLKNNALAFPNQSTPDWDRILAGMAGQPLTPGQARRVAPGTAVKVTGATAPGDAGPLVAPISGQPCVWYRCFVQYGSGGRLVPLPAAGRISDTMLVAQASNVMRPSRNPGDEISDTPFRIVDPDGGWITIDPRVADVNSDVVTRNRIVNSRFGLLQQLLVEWIVPVGAPVVALGTVVPGMDLDASSSAFQFVSTRPQNAILDRARAGHGADSHESSLRSFRLVSRLNRINSGAHTALYVFFGALVLALIVLVLVTSL